MRNESIDLLTIFHCCSRTLGSRYLRQADEKASDLLEADLLESVGAGPLGGRR